MAAAGLAGAIVLFGVVAPAAAQDRAPASRQALVDLANVLGQSHAIRQACSNRKDFSWFRRMEGLLRVEAPDQALKNRLVRSFNEGYAAGQASYPSCGKESQAAAVRLAQRGQALAGELGQ